MTQGMKLTAGFECGCEMLVFAEENRELVWIELDAENQMVNAWYRRYSIDTEHNAFCEQLVQELFVAGEHIMGAIRRFNARPDILRPAGHADNMFNPVDADEFAEQEVVA